MSKFERLAIYAVLMLLTLWMAGGGSRFSASQSAAIAAAAPAVQPEPAKLATCDIYEVIRVLVESDRYKPARHTAQETARKELQSIADDIRNMEHQLKGMDPKDDAALQLFKDYNVKKEMFTQRQAELDSFLGNQFVQAYEVARKAVDAVADRRGFSHVIASRRQDDKPSNDMDKVTQAMLSRPVLRAPAIDDITDDVLTELKL